MVMKVWAALLLLAAPLHGALLVRPASGMCRRSVPTMAMSGGWRGWPGTKQERSAAEVDVESAAETVREALRLDVVQLDVVRSFVAATERGDAPAAMKLCTDDFVYKTHRATTNSLSAAQDRFRQKVPAPSKVNTALHEESPGVFVRDIVVKPIPIVTVAIRQEFELRTDESGVRLCRAEYIKQ